MNRSIVLKNAYWIIVCKVFQSILGLFISMFTARYLGPSNFGVIKYAESIVAFVVPIMQLGINNVLVQELVDNPNEEGQIVGSALLMSLLSSLCCVLGVFSFVMVANHNETETIVVCILYSLVMIFQAVYLIEYWFQSKLLSKYSSIVALVGYFFVSVYKIVLLILNKSVYWFAISNVLDYMIISIIDIVIYFKLGGSRLCFSKKIARRMVDKGKYYILSAMMITIFAQTDKIMLKLMITNEATGFYSAAIACAGMTSFVFTAIIDSARPSIFRKRKTSKESFNNSMILLYSVIIYFALAQSAVMTVFAPFIVKVLYGNSYLESIRPLQIVVWYTTFSYIGGVRNVWILAENKQKYLWIINLSGAIANVCLNAVMIPICGIIGASIASLITQFFTNVIVGYIIPDIRANNQLIHKSLNPYYLWNFWKNNKFSHSEETK